MEFLKILEILEDFTEFGVLRTSHQTLLRKMILMALLLLENDLLVSFFNHQNAIIKNWYQARLQFLNIVPLSLTQ